MKPSLMFVCAAAALATAFRLNICLVNTAFRLTGLVHTAFRLDRLVVAPRENVKIMLQRPIKNRRSIYEAPNSITKTLTQ